MHSDQPRHVPMHSNAVLPMACTARTVAVKQKGMQADFPPCALKSSELTKDCRKVVLNPGRREGFSFIRKSAIVSL